MKIRSLRYYMSEAFINLFRNRLMTLASIVTVISCIFIVAFSYCIVINIDEYLSNLEDSLSFSIFMKDGADPETVTKLFNEIEVLENVKEVDYISQEEALEIYASGVKDAAALLSGFDIDNPLPITFVVKFEDAKLQDDLMRKIESMKTDTDTVGSVIDSVSGDKQAIDFITTLNTGVQIVSLIIIVVLVVISVVIITNTIKLTVDSRKTEISIMKYIGATDWFIRWPFIIEGMLIGLIGAVIPLVVSWFSYTRVLELLKDVTILQGVVDFKTVSSVFMILIPLCLVIGVGMGIIGSVTSIRKHLYV